MRGIAVMFGIVLVFIATTYWKTEKHQARILTFVRPDSEIKQVELEKLKPPVPPKMKQVATIQHTTPVIIKEVETTVREIEEIAKEVAIGTDTHNGPEPVTNALSSPEPTVTTAAPVEPAKEPEILHRSEIMPEFPGGDAAMRRFLQKNMRFDFEEMEAGSRIEIRCRFVVDKDGKVKGIEITKTGGGGEFDKEVTRVIAKMPDWKPGYQNGRNVAVYFTLPVIVEVPEQ
jgi:protein TonB